MTLTNSFIRNAQPTRNVQMISDVGPVVGQSAPPAGDGKSKTTRQVGAVGLNLIIQAKRTDGHPSAKTFVWRGRIDGKVKKITIGRADVMDVEDARLEANKIGQAVRQGRDPHAEAIEIKAARRARAAIESTPIITVDQAWRFYMDAEGSFLKTADEKERQYGRDVQPVVGSKDITKVTTDDLAKLVNTVGKRAPIMGDRTQALLSRFFKWSASSKGRFDTGLTINPMVGVEKPYGKVNRRERYLNEKEIRWFLQAVREIQAEARPYVKVRNNKGHFEKREAPTSITARWAIGLETLLRTGQRFSDIFDLKDDEIDFEEHTIKLEGIRHKSGSGHVIFLTGQVEDLLQRVDRPDATSLRSNAHNVFQRIGSLTTNVDRVRARMEKIAGKSIPHWTPHDLRRTFASTVSDMVDETERPIASMDDIRRVMGQKITGTSSHYIHNQAVNMKRYIMREWNEYLDALMVPTELAKAA